MLDINLVREHPEVVREAMQKRQMDPGPVDEVLSLDAERRGLLTKVETLKARRNTVSKEISRSKDPSERNKKIEAMRNVGDEIAALDEQLREVEQSLDAAVAILPNIPDPSVPVGKDEDDNVVVRTIGTPRSFDFTPRPHWDLAPELGILNFEQGVRLTGSRFYVLSGAGARLQRALIAWMLDLHIRQGYLEKYTPFMVRSETLFGAGQLPKFQDNLYKDHEEDLWMVPTAEVPLTGIHMGDVIDQADLPLNYTAYTPCFRREKMSAGRDVRGIKRGHQFDKVELYKYCLPEDSPAEHQKLLRDAEEVCSGLGLTYRVIQQCTGDLSFASHITFDLEVWAPGCGEWLEVSSVSNVGDFQARRANIKYRPAGGGKPRFLHTLNGSGLGLPRTLIAVLENYQTIDSSVRVPEVLLPWMGGIDVIRPEQTVKVS
ncbi:MAG TPA: serine--tRNA ligase [Anaerolineaceae bacterium]|nr:serine--tRNA ligase [Anaerolineaceae bacterium]